MKIGIVNDSAIAVEALRRTLAQRPGLEVAWVAHDGAQAVQMCAPVPPDLVLMDLVMPVMDGVAATREIMRRTPCPILIVTSDVGHHASLVFDAMGAGAVDAVDTPVLGAAELARPASSLLAKIEAVAAQQADARIPQTVVVPRAVPETDALVAIGASAGGPAALATLLGRLPANFAAGVIVVQHVDDAFAPGMAAWLDQQTPLSVRLVESGERPMAGAVLLAGGKPSPAGGRQRSLRVYRRTQGCGVSSVHRRLPAQCGRELALARGRRASDGDGPRRCSRAGCHAHAGLHDHRAGSRDERGVRHAQGGGRSRCRVANPAAEHHRATIGDAVRHRMTVGQEQRDE